MSRQRRTPVVNLCHWLSGIGLLLHCAAVQADWIDWWQTPEQQAEAALAADDIEGLKSVAPNALWRGVAEHKDGEFETATQSFDQQATEYLANGQVHAANQALYNRGVSEVLNEQYEKAVQTFNEVLEADPQFTDAQHNRDIAMQLIEQQQQEQQQPQEGDEQEPGDSSESEGGESSDESSDEGEPGESSQQEDAQEGDAGQDSQDDAQSPEAASEEQRRQEEQAAQEALEAERQADASELSEQEGDEGEQPAGSVESEQPLTESEQATEQWLRRIPDDPAGLLRRKLLQSHQLEYPEVRDAQQPW